MNEEIGWRKTIPQDRDRTQSQALVLTMTTLLAALCLQTAVVAWPLMDRFPAFVFAAFGICIVFAVLAVALRAATPAGAACGGMVCLLLTFWLGHYFDSPLRTGLTPLVALFLLTFTATRMGKQRKFKKGLAESRRGRSAAQVIANLAIAGVTSSWLGAAFLLGCIHKATHGYAAPMTWTGTVVLATLAEATADTVSSEIGQAFGGEPVLLTTLRRAPTGTDGAITSAGTIAGIAAAAIVSLTGQWALRLGAGYALIALLAAIAGLFFDSLLGATVERRGWIGNDLVNFASTLFAALVALGLVIVLV